MSQPARARVVVVGAGAAGLAAATALSDAGCRVLCLEARGRTGGRLLSTAGEPGAGRTGALDLGATWFWDGETEVQALVSRLGLATFDQHIAGGAVFQDASGAHRLAGNPIDSLALRYATGADALTEGLASALPPRTLRLDTPVTAIRPIAGGLEVETPGERHPADHVVLAVPPSLAVARIDLTDALPGELTRLAAATPVWMGAVAKVVAVYDAPFWRTEGLAGAAFSRIGPLQELHDMSGPAGEPAALFGFAPAGAVRPGFRPAVLAQLAALFGPAAGHPRRLHVQDWSREEWTSPPGVDRLGDYGLFGHAHYRRPGLGGRLHWASTETASEFAGHLEGALRAGRRAADAVLASSSAPAPTVRR